MPFIKAEPETLVILHQGHLHEPKVTIVLYTLMKNLCINLGKQMIWISENSRLLKQELPIFECSSLVTAPRKLRLQFTAISRAFQSF